MRKAICFGQHLGRVEYKAEGGFVDPSALSDEEFADLVTRVRSGVVRSLGFRARVFGDKPNANMSRPTPGRLSDLAANSKGALYKRGHATRAGDITAARAVEQDGLAVLEADFRITDAQAQEDFLRGLSDRFSPGIQYDTASCSICGAEAEDGFWGPVQRCHNPGQTYDGQLAEIFLGGDLRLVEVSSVDDPAYDDTQILAAYSRANETGSPLWGTAPHHHEEAKMSDKTQAAPPETPAPIVPPVEVKSAEFAALEAKAAASDAKFAKQQAELEAARELTFSMLFAEHVKAGRVTEGNREAIRAHYGVIGHEAAAAYLSSLPVAAVLGEKISEAGSDETKVKPDATFALAAVMAKHGILKDVSPEALKRSGFFNLRKRA